MEITQVRQACLKEALLKEKELRAIPETVYQLERTMWDAVDAKKHGKVRGKLTFELHSFSWPESKHVLPEFSTIIVEVFIDRHNPYFLVFQHLCSLTEDPEIYREPLLLYTDWLHNENEDDVPEIQKRIVQRLQELSKG